MREIRYRAWNKQKEIMNYDNEDGTEDYWDGIYILLKSGWLTGF